MNNKHILDLTLRLSQALDQNYDVVSMETVLSVISSLEGTTITKEQLEATRLAKYINQLRRRTKCENLARRAKSLLKRWREMVGMQQSNESTVSGSGVANQTASSAITCVAHNSGCHMPVSDNASHLINPQFSHQIYQRQSQCSSNIKQPIHDQTNHSQSSPCVNIQEKSDPNKFGISLSNSASATQMPKNSNTNASKKRKFNKSIKESSAEPQLQPTSFANLISGLSSVFNSPITTIKEISEPVASALKPVETFLIEHSSNSNSDLIYMPSKKVVSNNFTSTNDVPPVVIDLQDTNSSMNSVMSKDGTNASSSLYRNNVSAKRLKKSRKRKDRTTSSQQNQPLQENDDQNTKTVSCQNQRPSDPLLLDEKSHSACPTISNISEILSLSNSSVSSVLASPDASFKNIYQPGQTDSPYVGTKMTKSDLTFAGKFKQTSNLISSCNVMNYSSDSTNISNLNYNFPKQSKFLMFGGIGTNSNDSSSSSRTSSLHIIDNAVKREASITGHNMEDGIVKHNFNEKSTSNMSNKGNSSTDNIFSVATSAILTVAQQQQSIDLTMDFSSQLAIKQPKKRGRKKGSKGIDSIIAKDTSLSSQMLMSSLGVAGKKVKTTKELYAEMESRNLRNVNITALGETLGNSYATWTEHQLKVVSSPRPSFCSEIGDSDSWTMTSEPSHDSGTIVSKATVGKNEKILNNNSNFSKDDFKLKSGYVNSNENRLLSDESNVLESTSKIKLEIQRILKLLTLPPSITDIEYECFNSVTPCTCTVEEISAPANNEYNESIVRNNYIYSNINATNLKNLDEEERNHISIKIQEAENLPVTFRRVENYPKDTLTQKQPAKLKKSIFDLDFDDGENPINSIIANITSKNSKAETETLISTQSTDDKLENPSNLQDCVDTSDLHNASPSAPNVNAHASDSITFSCYEVKLDPDCKAKNRFEIQTQKITKFHVDALHNCFVPNVNGNWNYADAVNNPQYPITYDDNINKTDIVHGYDVVPFYGSDVNEKIIKDLSHVKFSKLHEGKHSKSRNQIEILFHIPFLGVSRVPHYDGKNLHRKVICMETIKDEKGNFHKLNLNNIPNTSALDNTDDKDKQKLEMLTERKQNFKVSSNTTTIKSSRNLKSGIKRAKKYATLVKKSTIKRLKLAISGSSDREEISDSNDTGNIGESKLHTTLFYHEELCSTVRKDSALYKECTFQISSCSSGCSSAGEEDTNESFSFRNTNKSASFVSSSLFSEHQMLDLQKEIIRAEIAKTAYSVKNENCMLDSSKINHNVSAIADDCDAFNGYEANELLDENNHMLLSFNNIYNKSTREENHEQQNKDHKINMLKQQPQNCDHYNNLKNFNLIKYIDSKSSSICNINNNNNSCSNNYSDTNINIISSSCNSENPTKSTLIYHQQYNNSNDDEQMKSFKEFKPDIHPVNDDVNDFDHNNCSRLQQFKEWYEVLQFRSYNDEILTILPYVILE